MDKTYICIDLKSFYASVECVERGLNPLNTNLVVADGTRTTKTICLAVTPSLKKYGIAGRARLFEVIQKVKEINRERRKKINGEPFRGNSVFEDELDRNPYLELKFIIAIPRMGLYVKYSTQIYEIYLQYISKDDIHVYSIDEVFMDVTPYLTNLKTTAEKLAQKMIKNVLRVTGVTATAGIGDNMYLAKVAMDIVAKHVDADADGVRIARLNEISYREKLWHHTPITDFWRIGPGIARRLSNIGIRTMGELALVSLNEEDLLFDIFGINAEHLINHAWGYEPTTIQDIKDYKPNNRSLGIGQVLHSAYPNDQALTIVKEMAENLSLSLVSKNLVCKNISLGVCYDTENLSKPELMALYDDDIVYDAYGRPMPKPVGGGYKFSKYTSSTSILVTYFSKIFTNITNKMFTIRRINVSCDIYPKSKVDKTTAISYNLFPELNKLAVSEIENFEKEQKEEKAQIALLEIKKRFGKNAVIKGIDLCEGATQVDRNKQIGGHKE